jgi:4-amino-4-deoxychorismate lyase
VLQGTPQHWARHYEKLASDCAAIALCCPDEPLLREDLQRACGSKGSFAIKIIVSRGPGERGYAYSEKTAPTRVVLSGALPNYPQTYAQEGVRVRRCRLKLAHQPALAGVKHLNRLENVLARAEWTDPDIQEGILCDVEDNVIGGTMTNLFVVKNAQLATPSLQRCGVAGVTRDRVIAAAARHGVPCQVKSLSWSEVVAADEIFVVNSLAAIWPVRAIDGKTSACGALTKAAQGWLNQEDHAQVA